MCRQKIHNQIVPERCRRKLQQCKQTRRCCLGLSLSSRRWLVLEHNACNQCNQHLLLNWQLHCFSSAPLALSQSAKPLSTALSPSLTHPHYDAHAFPQQRSRHHNVHVHILSIAKHIQLHKSLKSWRLTQKYGEILQLRWCILSGRISVSWQVFSSLRPTHSTKLQISSPPSSCYVFTTWHSNLKVEGSQASNHCSCLCYNICKGQTPR